MLLNIDWSLRTVAWRVEMLVLMTAPCCRDDWVQLVSVTVLRNNLWASMYILAKEEGSARLGSIPANLTSSVMEVLRIANCLDDGDLLQLPTLGLHGLQPPVWRGQHRT